MDERTTLEQAIAALVAQREALGPPAADALLALARARQETLGAAAPLQRKQISVLFADVVGFTAFAEAQDPEDVHDAVNSLWMCLDEIIVRHGGRIDKHIGDAVMALFGADVSQEDDAERAVRAALDMQEALIAWNATARLETPLALRIGIHLGPVLLGEVGSTREFTALGDTVNVANRLEQAAPPGRIVISQAVTSVVHGMFDLTPQPPVMLKGKSEPFQIYYVDGLRPYALQTTTRGMEWIHTGMVGRAVQLRVLQETYEALLEDRSWKAVILTGEAGIGKTRLWQEFARSLESRPNAGECCVPAYQILKAHFTLQSGRAPYALARDLCIRTFDIAASDSQATARAKLEKGIVAVLGDDAQVKAHFIGHLIGLEFSDSPYLQHLAQDARQIRDRAFHYLTQFVVALSARAPVLLVIDDLHWADPESLALLNALARACRKSPVMLIALTRATLFDAHPGWGKSWTTHRIDMPALSLAETGDLLARLLPNLPDIPPALQQMMADRAGGNPFYVEELVKMLLENGAIVPDTPVWKVDLDHLTTLRLPTSLTAVLQARLDRLPAGERDVLQRAAIIGRVFWDAALQHMNESGGADLPGILETLQAKRFIYARRASAFSRTREYAFRHTLLQEVAYDSVLKRRRPAYHSRVADWLSQAGGERRAEFAGLIGEHYERAGEMAPAAHWYRQAGEMAQKRYAPLAALNYFEKALQFLPPEAAERVILYDHKAQVLLFLLRRDEAAGVYQTMLLLAEDNGDLQAQARAWNGLGSVYATKSKHQASLACARRAEQLARESEDQAELLRALYSQGWEAYRLGDTDTAQRLGEDALALSTALNAQRDRARSLNLLGAVQDMRSQPEQAKEYKRRSLELYEAAGDQMMVGIMLNNLGATAENFGDHAEAASLFQRALTIAEDIGDQEGVMLYLSNLAGSRVGLGAYAEAEADLRRVLQMANAAGGFFAFSGTCYYLAEACMRQNKLTAAWEAAWLSLQHSKDSGRPQHLADSWRIVGMVLTQALIAQHPPLWDTATPEEGRDPRTCFATSLRLHQEQGNELEQAITLREWARLELAAGDAATGLTHRRAAREILTRLNLPHELEKLEELQPPAISDQPSAET